MRKAAAPELLADHEAFVEIAESMLALYDTAREAVQSGFVLRSCSRLKPERSKPTRYTATSRRPSDEAQDQTPQAEPQGPQKLIPEQFRCGTCYHQTGRSMGGALNQRCWNLERLPDKWLKSPHPRFRSMPWSYPKAMTYSWAVAVASASPTAWHSWPCSTSNSTGTRPAVSMSGKAKKR